MSEPASDEGRLLARLRTPAAAERLVDRWVADLLARPLGDLAPPSEVARLAVRLIGAGSKSDAFHRWIEGRVEAELQGAQADTTRLQDHLPAEVLKAARELTVQPYSPDRAVVVAILDREPVRKLIRALLVDVLIEFGRRVASLASPLTGSRVGRGLGALGALAGAVGSGVVGAVSGELERQVEKRAAEFADLGISRVLQRLADLASDPSLAADQAELRAAILEGFLELRRTDVARELRRQNPRVVIQKVREAARAFASRPESSAVLGSQLERVLGIESKRSLGAVLEDLGLRAEVEAVLKEVLLRRARAFDWAAWLEAEIEASRLP